MLAGERRRPRCWLSGSDWIGQGTEYGRRPDAAVSSIVTAAYGALRHMGFRETESKEALAAVRSHVGAGGILEDTVPGDSVLENHQIEPACVRLMGRDF